MCGAVTVAIALCLALLVPAGVMARSAFVASAEKHRTGARVELEESRDDAGLTAFERVHLRKVITNDFAGQHDAELSALVVKTRACLGLSVGIAGVLVVLLMVRTSTYCS
jgi:hypothetical protein